MKKKLILVIAISMFLLMTENVYAKDLDIKGFVIESEVTFESSILRAEVTGYRYRVYNGVLERRLWSYTYEKWLEPSWTAC